MLVFFSHSSFFNGIGSARIAFIADGCAKRNDLLSAHLNAIVMTGVVQAFSYRSEVRSFIGQR